MQFRLKKMPGPYKIVIIKCFKKSFKRISFYFATLTVRKLIVFKIYNRAYLYILLKYNKFGKKKQRPLKTQQTKNVMEKIIFWLKHRLE